jgi:TnpA family transposase
MLLRRGVLPRDGGHGKLPTGEQLHALRRAIFYANEGRVPQRTLEQQGEQALCLAMVVNAIIVGNTVYTQRWSSPVFNSSTAAAGR